MDDPHLYVANFGIGEQPAREERYDCEDVVLELLDQYRLHNGDLVTRRCRMVVREQALRAGGREMKRRAVSVSPHRRAPSERDEAMDRRW